MHSYAVEVLGTTQWSLLVRSNWSTADCVDQTGRPKSLLCRSTDNQDQWRPHCKWLICRSTDNQDQWRPQCKWLIAAPNHRWRLDGIFKIIMFINCHNYVTNVIRCPTFPIPRHAVAIDLPSKPTGYGGSCVKSWDLILSWFVSTPGQLSVPKWVDLGLYFSHTYTRKRYTIDLQSGNICCGPCISVATDYQVRLYKEFPSSLFGSVG